MTDSLNRERSSYKEAPQTNQANKPEAAYVPRLQPCSLRGVEGSDVEAVSLKLLDETERHNESRIQLQKCVLRAQLWERRCKESEAERRRLEGEIQRVQKEADATEFKEIDGFQDNSLAFRRSNQTYTRDTYNQMPITLKARRESRRMGISFQPRRRTQVFKSPPTPTAMTVPDQAGDDT
ncbi:hypothetical protein V501_00470 [Pseudogymnoascus sp. VKM F-4519 (FW-2642)]|nr:hypothetical protein V501_00470 [Pseudogymnoascus sp. VKM F-4519 (FW-2642)]